MPETTESPQYLTVDETAAILGVHFQTVMNYIRKGILKSSQLGGKGSPHRISLESVKKLMEEK
jgi:excisionase family DNA binding protein